MVLSFSFAADGRVSDCERLWHSRENPKYEHSNPVLGPKYRPQGLLNRVRTNLCACEPDMAEEGRKSGRGPI